MNNAPTQNVAWHNLFLAIYTENGYYDNLRYFAKKKGYTNDQMAGMLTVSYLDNSPDGMGPYYFMDSLEDEYPNMDDDDSINDVYDMVDYLWDHQAWKE